MGGSLGGTPPVLHICSFLQGGVWHSSHSSETETGHGQLCHQQCRQKPGLRSGVTCFFLASKHWGLVSGHLNYSLPSHLVVLTRSGARCFLGTYYVLDGTAQVPVLPGAWEVTGALSGAGVYYPPASSLQTPPRISSGHSACVLASGSPKLASRADVPCPRQRRAAWGPPWHAFKIVFLLMQPGLRRRLWQPDPTVKPHLARCQIKPLKLQQLSNHFFPPPPTPSPSPSR